MVGLSESEKNKQKALVHFDLAKKFVSNVTTILESEEPDWEYLSTKTSLVNDVLTLKFRLKESGIEKQITKLDKAQRRLDEEYEIEEQNLSDITS